jgi:hypothetical protein
LAVAGRQYSPALDAFIKVARVRDWTNALDKLRCESSPAWNKDNVRKADAQGEDPLIQITGPSPASSPKLHVGCPTVVAEVT